jgi:hypothetical protein
LDGDTRPRLAGELWLYGVTTIGALAIAIRSMTNESVDSWVSQDLVSGNKITDADAN